MVEHETVNLEVAGSTPASTAIQDDVLNYVVSQKMIRRILRKTYDGFNYMIETHPKAARKKRNLKKWRKRFGAPLSEYLYKTNPFLQLVPKCEWQGAYIPVPLYLNND